MVLYGSYCDYSIFSANGIGMGPGMIVITPSKAELTTAAFFGALIFFIENDFLTYFIDF